MKLAAQFVDIFTACFSGATSSAVCIHLTNKYAAGLFRAVIPLKNISSYYKRATVIHSSQCPAMKKGINMLQMPCGKPPMWLYFEKCSSHHTNSRVEQGPKLA